MQTNNRCKYNLVYDSLTKRYRCCKNKKKFGNYCLYHNKILFEKYAIKIQSAYKGFYIRRKLKIYYNLPRDLQRKIIWHVNTDIYQKHFYSSVFKLIKNRYIKFIRDTNYYNIILNYSSHIYYIKLHHPELYKEFIMELLSIMKISIKYYQIIDTKKIEKYIMIIKKFNEIYIQKIPRESEEFVILSRYNLLIHCY